MRIFSATAAAVVALFALTSACQDQHSDADPNNPANPPGEQYLELIGDTIVPSPELRRLLQEQMKQYPHIKNITPIPRPFRDALPILQAYKIRCKVAPTQTFIAEKTKIEADRSFLGQLRLIWHGKLLNTGKPGNNVDENMITLYLRSDSTVTGRYTFESGYLLVTGAERYDINGQEMSSTWFLTRSNPSEIVGPSDSVIVIPKKPLKSH